MIWKKLLPVQWAARPVEPVWQVHTDGAVRPEKSISGLGAVARDGSGRIRKIWSRQAGPMTNNEAEYAAALMALEGLRRLRVQRVRLYSDSRTLVDQFNGQAGVHVERLRPLLAEVRRLASCFDEISFFHIPREQNCLADALASEAVQGLAGKTGGNYAG